ncbi:MAG: CrcB family protein [Pseudorhodobacter sp.]
MIWTLSQVALGGAIGSALRFLTVAMVGAPLATMIVNVAGSFVMGVLFIILAPRITAAPFLMAGILGGFTTFSAFSLDAYKLYEAGLVGQAAGYVAGSVVLSILALVLGVVFARGVLA